MAWADDGRTRVVASTKCAPGPGSVRKEIDLFPIFVDYWVVTPYRIYMRTTASPLKNPLSYLVLVTFLTSSLHAKLLDDFNDNIKTAWTDTPNGGSVGEAGGVFTIITTGSPGALTSSKKTSDLFTNALGHTIELRVNVNSIIPGGAATNGHAVLGWVPSGALNSSGYSLSVGVGDITIYRAGVGIYTSNLLTAIQSTNLLVVMRLTPSGGAVNIRASVYKKGNGDNLLLFEHTVNDATGIVGAGNAALGALNSPSGAAGSAVFDDLQGFDILNAQFSSSFGSARFDVANPSSGVYATSDGWIDYRPVNGNATNGTINNTNIAGELEVKSYNIPTTYLSASYYNGTTFKISDGSRLEFEVDIKTGSDNPVIIPIVSYLPNGLPDLATLATYFIGDSVQTVVAGKSASTFWHYFVGTSTVKYFNVRLIQHMSGEGTTVRLDQRIEDLDVADVNDPARVIFQTSYLDSTASYINKNGYFCLLAYHANTANAGNSCTFDNPLVNRTAPGNTPPIIGSVSPGDGITFLDATNRVTFTVADDVNTPLNNIVLTLNGVRYTNGTPGVNITPTSTTSTLRTFTLSNLTANVYYNGDITATDNQAASSTVHYEFDTFSPTNLTVEVEDYNFSTNGTDGGVFIDNPTLVAEPGTSATSYNGVTGLQDIDFHDNQGAPGAYGDPNHSYRSDNPRQYHTADGPRKKYLDAGGTGAGFYETQLASDVANGDWLNYSRTFPAGTYNVYIREGNYNMAYMLAALERVTSNPATNGQTTRPLGYFFQLGGVAGDTGFDVHRTLPLTDASGNKVIVRFAGGVDTVRLREIFTDFHSDTFQNYMVFVNVPDPGTLRPIVALTSPIAGSAARMSSQPEGTFASIARRDTTVNVGTVALLMNGVAVPSAVVSSDGDGGATVTWSLTNVPPTRIITNTVTFTDSDGTNLTYSWTYSYPFLSATNRLALGSLVSRGFAHRTAQDNAADGDSLIRAEQQLAIPPEIVSALNFATNQQTLDWNNDNGNPQDVPGLAGAANYIATEDLAYLELTAGGHRFTVASDDGFQLRSGHTPSDLNATILSQSDGDTFGGTFDFVVEADGLYPVRNIWYEQEGGAHFTLSSYNFSAAANVVVNDPLDPAGVVKAYLPIGLYSSATVDGPYTPEAVAVDIANKTVTVPQSGPSRYYRLYGSGGTTITSVVISGSNVVLTYQ
jgi:hypothetical protein